MRGRLESTTNSFRHIPVVARLENIARRIPRPSPCTIAATGLFLSGVMMSGLGYMDERFVNSQIDATVAAKYGVEQHQVASTQIVFNRTNLVRDRLQSVLAAASASGEIDPETSNLMKSQIDKTIFGELALKLKINPADIVRIAVTRELLLDENRIRLSNDGVFERTGIIAALSGVAYGFFMGMIWRSEGL